MEYSKNIISLALLFSLSGCSDDFSGGNRAKPEAQAEVAIGRLPARFSTRLNDTLSISGEKCRGNETTESYGNGDLCNAGQYLISIDNVNFCTNNICTTNVVTPIVAELINSNNQTDGITLFEINAISVTTSTQENILDSVLVQSDSLGNGFVFFK